MHPNNFQRLGSLIVMIAVLSACRSDSSLRPFTSDGCSLFPDGSPISEQDWCQCCFEHDIAYWKGGTQEDRKAADIALRECVADRTDNRVLASMMYEGVRVGGSPYFYNWYRWGYGWPYERKYQALTQTEQVTAAALLRNYRANVNSDEVCSSTDEVR
ncbi:MAG: hypothetical protein AB8F65_10930 [Woeseiaceae bacterium]